MSLASMTGYARADGEADGARWTWEAKSVNGRSLDVRCRMPPGMESLEPIVRGAVTERFARGSVSVSLQFTRTAANGAARINRPLLEQLIGLAGELADTPGVAPPRLDGLLAARGVVELGEPEDDEDKRAAREGALRATLGTALDALARAREEEGARLGAVLGAQLDELARLTTAAREAAAAQPARIRARLNEQVAALLEAVPALPEERLAQEAALLMVKADVREELDRLEVHAAQSRALLAGEGAAGRRLDFLAQELNRESNTLCAKSADTELTAIGLELKAAVDRLREQLQNIE